MELVISVIDIPVRIQYFNAALRIINQVFKLHKLKYTADLQHMQSWQEPFLYSA